MYMPLVWRRQFEIQTDIYLFVLFYNRCGLKTDAPKLDNRARESLNPNPNPKLQRQAKSLRRPYHRHADTQAAAETFGARPTILFGPCLLIPPTRPSLTTVWQWQVPILHSCHLPLPLRITAQVRTVGRTCLWNMRTCIPWHRDKKSFRVALNVIREM